MPLGKLNGKGRMGAFDAGSFFQNILGTAVDLKKQELLTEQQLDAQKRAAEIARMKAETEGMTAVQKGEMIQKIGLTVGGILLVGAAAIWLVRRRKK